MNLAFLPYVAAAAASGLGGGLLATVWRPGRWVTSYIQHFAAGLVIAAVALKVAPDLERTHAHPALVLGGFALGGLFMIGVKWATLRIEERQRRVRGKPWGLTAAAAIDTAIDGAIIGAGFAFAEGSGAVLSVALGLELLFLTLSVGASFRQEGSRWMALAVTSGISLLLLAGAVGGMLLLRGKSVNTLAAVLSFGAAALLYLVTEELLVETRLPEETLLSTAMFFLGFLAILGVVVAGPAWGR